MSARDNLLVGLAALVGIATGLLPFGGALVGKVVRPAAWDLTLVLLPLGAAALASSAQPLMDQVLAVWLPTAVATAVRCALEAMELPARRGWMTAVLAACAAVATWVVLSGPAR